MTAWTLLRPARADDADAIARVQVRGWRAAHRGELPAGFLAGLSVEERARGWRAALAAARAGDGGRTLVAVRGRRVLGFAHVGASGEGDARGRLHALYVDPRAWGRGVGQALADAALAALAGQGFREADLWVLEGNGRGRRFYEAGGWVADGVWRTQLYGGAAVRLLRYRRPLDAAVGSPVG